MFRSPLSWALPTLCGALTLFGALGCERPTGEARGPRLFETCQSCHGDNGEGNEEFHAPAIAGMPQWYLQRQLEKFRAGHRGADPDDQYGLRMRGIVRTLNHEGDLEAIAEYVSSLPPVAPADAADPPLEGDAEAGHRLYATCVECHGENGAGNPERDAPPLTGLNDWYIVAQLSLFKDGDRGTLPGDATGATMRPMALGLADEAAMADVAAYIATLRGGQ